MDALGLLYVSGRHVPRDPATGFAWFGRAGDLGHRISINNTAWFRCTSAFDEDLDAAKGMAAAHQLDEWDCRNKRGERSTPSPRATRPRASSSRPSATSQRALDAYAAAGPRGVGARRAAEATPSSCTGTVRLPGDEARRMRGCRRIR
jgi:TPR repeat protein